MEQLLAALRSSDAGPRDNAEAALDAQLENKATARDVVVALAQLGTGSPQPDTRQHALVLLRRVGAKMPSWATDALWPALGAKATAPVRSALMGNVGRMDRTGTDRHATADTIADLYALDEPGSWPQLGSTMLGLLSASTARPIQAAALYMLSRVPGVLVEQGRPGLQALLGFLREAGTDDASLECAHIARTMLISQRPPRRAQDGRRSHLRD